MFTNTSASWSSLSLIDPSELKNLRGESIKRQITSILVVARDRRSISMNGQRQLSVISHFSRGRTYWNSRVCSSSLIERSRRWLTRVFDSPYLAFQQ